MNPIVTAKRRKILVPSVPPVNMSIPKVIQYTTHIADTVICTGSLLLTLPNLLTDIETTDTSVMTEQKRATAPIRVFPL